MITAELRETVRKLFGYRCAYCGLSEAAIGGELEIDHFKPKSLDGGDELENLVYCCTSCNRRKGSFWAGDSPSIALRLLHPQKDDLAIHIREEKDCRLTPLTETGAFHIERLQLNRPRLVALRVSWRQEAGKEIHSLAEDKRLKRFQREITASAQRIQKIFDEINRMLNRS